MKALMQLEHFTDYTKAVECHEVNTEMSWVISSTLVHNSDGTFTVQIIANVITDINAPGFKPLAGQRIVEIANSFEDTPTIDVDKAMWEAILEAASKSTWMPPEYMVNDWVSDVCAYLKEGDSNPRVTANLLYAESTNDQYQDPDNEYRSPDEFMAIVSKAENIIAFDGNTASFEVPSDRRRLFVYYMATTGQWYAKFLVDDKLLNS